MSAAGVEGWNFATRQVHAGVEPEGTHHPRATPVYLTAGFVFDDFDQASARFAGTDDGHAYTRVSNPTHAALERRIAALEGGSGATFLGSGQAAVSTALLALAATGDHIVAASSLYEGSRELLRENFARLGIDVTFVARTRDLEAWEAAITPRTKALFAETIPNPKNDLLDIAGVADIAHRAGVPLVVDNTLASPYLLRPIEHGADIVVHSASKFLSGHGTVLGGLVVDGGSFEWARDPARYPHLAVERGIDGRTLLERAGQGAYLEYVRTLAMRFGPAASPLNAFLILQGIETLSLRVQRQSDSALALARWLERQPEVESVDYSGLDSSPHRDLARRYLPRGQGSVFGFTVRGGRPAAEATVNSLELFTRMTHLGDVRSLVLHPGSTTHVLRTEDDRLASGIDPGLLRLSIGVEDPEDLIRDLAQALAVGRAAMVQAAGTR
ncbi:O-acetylhomoserine aminocarboxypropyltransferase/cysteine synthase family protein [Microbacterium sp. RD1]|uniref:O-acetylhomoserine aminocarboxypropyltransferase/cysteine synthase family protein n=1 Tax=Microbacterium sp. RD1 TaxID=3457313 RepID=UPI003FA57F4E